MNDAPMVLFVRPVPGVVSGERERVVHVVPVPDPGAIPKFLTTYCGKRFGPGTTEWLTELRGAPCVRCLAVAPITGTEQIPGSSNE